MSDVEVDRIRVLHVDDDPEIVDLAATFLQREDDRLEVELAETAGDALERIQSGQVHCVISDYQLPDMNCDEFVTAAREQAPGIPFLLFTGRDRAQLDETLLDSTLTAYLQKGSGTEQYGDLADEILTAVADYHPVETDGGTPSEHRYVTDGGTDGGGSALVGQFLAGIDVDDREDVLVDALDTIEDGFFILDQNAEFVYWNEYISAVTGYDDDTIAEMDPAEFFVPAHRDRIETAISEAVEDGSAVVEAKVRQADGDEIPTEFRGSRLTNDDGRVVGIAGVARDISDRVAYEQELEWQNERLEELIGAVSHDLRNPLNVITGRIQLARELDDNEEHFDALERSTQRMEQLIDDLVELARKGKTVDETTAVALDELATKAWDGLDTADATLHIETTQVVQADESRLRQVLDNLFRNAVEHGGDDVTVTMGALDDGFYVEDDGPGIAPKSRERLLEYGESTTPEGTGLGLAIIRRIVEAHGWELTLTERESGVPDSGARFEVHGTAGE